MRYRRGIAQLLALCSLGRASRRRVPAVSLACAVSTDEWLNPLVLVQTSNVASMAAAARANIGLPTLFLALKR